ncbi:MAG: NAD(P)H-dependent oxidoreductase [Duganella sp.]
MNILHIDSCALGDQSQSRLHTAAVVAELTAAHEAAPAGMTLKYRDLVAVPLSHVSGPLLQAMSRQWNAAIPMHPDLRAEILLSAALLQEFTEADVVVVGAPMHNYFAPSSLKVWLDRLLHLHDDRNNGCMAEVRVVLVTSGWGAENAAQASQLRHYQQQLKAAFTAMGVRQLEVAPGANFVTEP